MKSGHYYRVIKLESGRHMIALVHHDKDGNPIKIEESVVPSGSTYQELVFDLTHMREAFSRPIIVKYENGQLIEEKNE